MALHTPFAPAVSTAMRILVDALGAQTHRDGQPAILHSIRIALQQDTEEGVILGLLHDVIEDAGPDWGIRIQKELGDRMFYLVSVVSRSEDESYEQYIQRIVNSEEQTAMKLKLDDIRDNMRPDRTDEKARNRAVMYGRAFDKISAILQ